MTTARKASRQKNTFSNKGEEKSERVELILIKKDGRKIPFLVNRETVNNHNKKVAAEVTKKRIINIKKDTNNRYIDNFNNISPYIC